MNRRDVLTGLGIVGLAPAVAVADPPRLTVDELARKIAAGVNPVELYGSPIEFIGEMLDSGKSTVPTCRIQGLARRPYSQAFPNQSGSRFEARVGE